MQNNIRKELEKNSVSALRQVARLLGVNKITTMKKSQLIDEIISVKAGNPPLYEKSCKGRPPLFNILPKGFLLDNVIVDEVEAAKITEELSRRLDEEQKRFTNAVNEIISNAIKTINALLK